jgi:hypothetical protein
VSDPKTARELVLQAIKGPSAQSPPLTVRQLRNNASLLRLQGELDPVLRTLVAEGLIVCMGGRWVYRGPR